MKFSFQIILMIYCLINEFKLQQAFDLANLKEKYVQWYNIRGYENVGQEYLDMTFPKTKYLHLHTTYGMLKSLIGEEHFQSWWDKTDNLELHVVAIFKK